MEPAVRFENVSKRFVFNKQKSGSFLESIISFFPVGNKNKPAPEDSSLWALRDVSFDILPGEGFGIIGRNGSGKSTALKMVARILQPNEGKIYVQGRVSALLELGAGFHPDLTGRENIYLNAAVLGLQEDEVAARFDDIVEFSELGKFIDMQVKYYSSGMFMRLGFSVAIHVEPDVLIVDEILAVGDQAFQTKCLDKILELKARGTTILMVSHNLNQLQTICTNLVWIEQGDVIAAGPTDDVISKYVAFSYERHNKNRGGELFERVGDREVEITAVHLLNEVGEETAVYKTNAPMTIEIEYHAHKPIPNPEFGIAIHRNDGVQVNGPNTRLAGMDLGVVEGKGVVQYKIETLPLLPASYQITTAVHDSRYPHCYDMHKNAYTFTIEQENVSELYGLVALSAHWNHTEDNK